LNDLWRLRKSLDFTDILGADIVKSLLCSLKSWNGFLKSL
jgi:hypothetical protein